MDGRLVTNFVIILPSIYSWWSIWAKVQ